MANDSVNHLLILINKQVECLENQNEALYKARALMDVALGDSFQDHSKSVIFYYLCVLDDILENTLKLSEESLKLFRMGVTKEATTIE
jgi:hypothetical protein